MHNLLPGAHEISFRPSDGQIEFSPVRSECFRSMKAARPERFDGAKDAPVRQFRLFRFAQSRKYEVKPSIFARKTYQCPCFYRLKLNFKFEFA